MLPPPYTNSRSLHDISTTNPVRQSTKPRGQKHSHLLLVQRLSDRTIRPETTYCARTFLLRTLPQVQRKAHTIHVQNRSPTFKRSQIQPKPKNQTTTPAHTETSAQLGEPGETAGVKKTDSRDRVFGCQFTDEQHPMAARVPANKIFQSPLGAVPCTRPPVA
jgi:hypothetical protein